jgi:hypothetical protein
MFHKSPVAANGVGRKWYILFLDIIQTKLGTFVDGHEQIII